MATSVVFFFLIWFSGDDLVGWQWYSAHFFAFAFGAFGLGLSFFVDPPDVKQFLTTVGKSFVNIFRGAFSPFTSQRRKDPLNIRHKLGKR